MIPMKGKFTMTDIDRETYIKADDPTHRGLTYDMLKSLSGKMDKYGDRCTSLEKRKLRDSASSSLFGLLGGFIAGITGWFKGV
jgi:hypothetical protein